MEYRSHPGLRNRGWIEDNDKLDGYLSSNPARGLKVQGGQEQEMLHLDAAQVRGVIDVVEELRPGSGLLVQILAFREHLGEGEEVAPTLNGAANFLRRYRTDWNQSVPYR